MTPIGERQRAHLYIYKKQKNSETFIYRINLNLGASQAKQNLACAHSVQLRQAI